MFNINILRVLISIMMVLKEITIWIIRIIVMLFTIINTLDLISFIKQPSEYFIGTESMIYNGGIKYISPLLYIISDTISIILCTCVFVYIRKYYSFIFIFFLIAIEIIFSKYGVSRLLYM